MTNTTAQLLEQHFDMAFSAPNGIKKLRELILILAMKGKLVPQNPNAQPASELLKEIAVEKERLVTEGKIKKQKPLPAISEDEIPYELPQGWEWVRLRDVSFDWGQKTPNNDFFYVDVGSVDNTKGLLIEELQTVKAVDAPSRARKLVAKGTVIYSTVRPYLLNIAVIEKDYDKELIASTAFAIIHTYSSVYNYFVYHYLKSSIFVQYVESAMKGVAYPAINDGDFFQGLCPLPPLDEQQRIVAKIDELMAKCDALEALQQAQATQRTKTHQAAIQQLLTTDDTSTAWQFLKTHFETIYQDKANVKELRKAILQLAVMGKLVPQDPKDQPASELLKEIAVEKERLVKEGKIKKQKPLLVIGEDEKPYQLPQGWKWVRLGEIANVLGGYAYKSNLFTSSGNNQVLRLGNIRPDLLRLEENPVFIDDSLGSQTIDYRLLANDILITMTGTRDKDDYLYSVRVSVNPVNDIHLYLNQRVGCIRCFIPSFYLNKAIKVTNIKSQIFSLATGTANQANIGINNLRDWIIPLPPLAEQQRIVAKIDQLMSLCDQLETRIDERTDKQSELLAAVMSEV
jgi:type I restriction enzyme S subunit